MGWFNHQLVIMFVPTNFSFDRTLSLDASKMPCIFSDQDQYFFWVRTIFHIPVYSNQKIQSFEIAEQKVWYQILPTPLTSPVIRIHTWHSQLPVIFLWLGSSVSGEILLVLWTYVKLWKPMVTLPETNIAHANPSFWWYLSGKMGMFMGYVNFREGNHLHIWFDTWNGCESKYGDCWFFFRLVSPERL